MANYCSKCKQQIGGMKYTHKGKTYCYACYQLIVAELTMVEQQKQVLYDYVKQLYNTKALSADIVYAVDKEISNGKTASGIQQALHYYYDILGYRNQGPALFSYIIHNFYDGAETYRRQTQATQDHNAEVDLNTPAVTVHVTPESLTPRKPQFSYNIEDL